MSLSERRRQFEAASKADPLVTPATRVARLFGVSNSAKVIGGGLQLGVVNLDKVTTANDGFAFACTIVFPPEDEVYFTVYIRFGASAMIDRLDEMKRLASPAAAKAIEDITLEDLESGELLSYSDRNNNVVVVLGDDGRIYLRNRDFWDTLPEDRTKLGPPILVDRVNVAIWPPAASVRRSLMAREFVGYLGRFVGREKVHELRVWDDASAVAPSMRRAPSDVPIADIRTAIQSMGGVYPDELVDRFHAGLNHLPDKHFVILPGVSGTGKTLLPRLYARAIHQVASLDAPDPLLFICPVRPEWTDPSGLTGYFDVLQNRYMVPPFLQALLAATAYPDAPVFVVLDEMNLARVEYYLADVLSSLESRQAIPLHSSSVPLEGSIGGEIPSSVALPSNLYLIGTINIDETTSQISDKVLDRAVVIDMSAVDLDRYFVSLGELEPELAASIAACGQLLSQVSVALSEHRQGFGYRLVREFIRYHAFASDRLGRSSPEILDDQLIQKALAKLRGGEGQRPMLNALRGIAASYPRTTALIERLEADLDEIGAFQVAR